ncbi:Sensor protein RstB [Ferriphaselus amnicola]|uniref:histidine kinase n=1 Tax=Ferriphaselus amnicola TaxID=1188319 RepID=A0A2Z6GAS1_9PROT|nr:ATP-binding protein [Ferriphaselus amnicola]BBE50550.1 Sensor protein RstB [Ferriphaselus amnicola]
MKKLYFQIYLGVIGSLALLVVSAGAFFHFQGENSPQNQLFQTMRDVIVLALPTPDAPDAQQQAVLEKLARPSLPRISLYAADHRLLAHTGEALPPPAADARDNDWLRRPDRDSAWAMHLPDGRWLLAQPQHDRPHTPLPLIVTLALIGLVVALVAYPMTRRMTKRLEGLKQAVESLGAGDFNTRVETRGCDEVSSLAKSFNLAAERIESLLGAHKQLLANASHELRSPLTRIRLALEMQAEHPVPELQAEMRQSLAELDQLIEEILLASRLDTTREPLHADEIDLAALLAEECARNDASYEAVPLTLNGDERLLRRLLRNLLENARRHGGDTVQAELERNAQRAVIRICDNGKGIAAEERERIFEPFYRPAGSREKEGSHGLGLALVRQIAERHGGIVRCLPRDTGGACFEVSLPLPH